jgi:hypothetical protein
MTYQSKLILAIAASGSLLVVPLAQASQSPVIDIPEEVLRAEIIIEARSPIDGKPLSAIEFAELVLEIEQKTERDDGVAAIENNSELKNLLFLIRLRGFFRSIGIPLQ